MQKTNTRTIKVTWSKNERKIFGAFKWNAYVIGMYEDILEKIINDPKWEDKYGYKWQVQYGSKFTYPVDNSWKLKVKPSDIEEFIHQNKQLYDVFVAGISSCDLFIADITNHNPNVMVELGIAVQQNKNILVVTSQDINNMEFDIHGLQAFKYTSKRELEDLIERQMEIYSEIKGQTFESDKFTPTKRYFPGIKDSIKKLTNKEAVQILGIPKLKNLRMKVDFRFLFSTDNVQDWFGISLRTSGPWRYNAELALVRYSGKTRSLTWPEQRKKENEGEDSI